MAYNVIISGLTGFVGSNLKPYLIKRGYSITGLSRKENPGKDTISYQVLDKEIFNKSKAFIHLAGKAHDLNKVSSDDEYYEINTNLTINLFDKFLESECELFVFMSTVKSVADHVDGILDENVIPNPLTTYGKSKLSAEKYLLSKNIPASKKVYILRPCMIHGPNNKGNLNLLYNIINKRIPYPLGSFKNKRSFLSIENLSFVINQLVLLKPKSGIYNVADDEAISTNTLVQLIGTSIGKKAVILNIPKSMVKFGSKLGDLTKLPLNSEKLNKLTENYCVSNAKLKTALNLELPISTREGIRQTIMSFKKK